MGIEVEVHRAKICMKECSWKCYAFVLCKLTCSTGVVNFFNA